MQDLLGGVRPFFSEDVGMPPEHLLIDLPGHVVEPESPLLAPDLGEEYDLEQQESFEALTSRFARTSDILTQKVFKSIFILLQEDVKTIIDTANFLEKLEIVDNADDLLNIREIRNQIAHEYVEPDIKSLYMDVLHYIPQLKEIAINVKAYWVEVPIEK